MSMLFVASWPEYVTSNGYIYVFPCVCVREVNFKHYNAVIRQVCEIECDCLTIHRSLRQFFIAFHDSVFDRGELDAHDYKNQLEISRNYITEYLELVNPQASVGHCDDPIWKDCY